MDSNSAFRINSICVNKHTDRKPKAKGNRLLNASSNYKPENGISSCDG